MAGKKRKIDTVGEPKKHKLELSTVLNALDHRNKKFYDKLTEEEKKAYTPLILMRFMSSAPDQNGIHEYHLMAINDLVNKDFWTLSKHPELQHLLMSLIGLGGKQYHGWIAGPKRGAKDKVSELLKEKHEGINELELQILLKQHSKESFSEYLEDCGIQSKEAKELIENFIKITS